MRKIYDKSDKTLLTIHIEKLKYIIKDIGNKYIPYIIIRSKWSDKQCRVQRGARGGGNCIGAANFWGPS
jgi:hypothetical protein